MNHFLFLKTTFQMAFILFSALMDFNAFAKNFSHVDCYGRHLDDKLVELINLDNGIFIEVGANDGVTQSNTKLLEDEYGWTGVLVEPSKILFETLCSNRPLSKCFQCALGSFEQNNTYVLGDFDGGLMSSVDGIRNRSTIKEKVLVRSLQSILNEVGISHINLFSLDTEGYELNILKGIDFSTTIFDYILIEIYPAEFNEITLLLNQYGYVLQENFSNYNHQMNPQWDGTHNDYLFKRVDLPSVKD